MREAELYSASDAVILSMRVPTDLNYLWNLPLTLMDMVLCGERAEVDEWDIAPTFSELGANTSIKFTKDTVKAVSSHQGCSGNSSVASSPSKSVGGLRQANTNSCERKPCLTRAYLPRSSIVFVLRPCLSDHRPRESLLLGMAQLDPIQQQFFLYILQQFEEDIANEENFRRIMSSILFSGNPLLPPGFRRANIDRERSKGHDQLMKDYFNLNSTYGPDMFRRRFRMRKPLFERVLTAVTVRNQYFVQKQDCTGLYGLSSLQKAISALRMLSYDKSADELDEHLRLGESTSLRCLKEFCRTVILVFGAEYLRSPTAADMERILKHSASRGFPGMLGSIDCMHWEWKNCPRGWAGQFTSRSGSATCVLEAVATYDLWIWHAFFGMPGSNNDINVLDRSPLFTDLLKGIAPTARFTINNRPYNMTYMLADGIYPKWPVFVATISNPGTEKWKHFAARQESVRKDVERCFGVLRGRWSILKNPCRSWNRSTLHSVITACIILHNMVVEDEQGSLLQTTNAENVEVFPGRVASAENSGLSSLPRMLAARTTMRNENAHYVLQNDLVEQLWSVRGQQEL